MVVSGKSWYAPTFHELPIPFRDQLLLGGLRMLRISGCSCGVLLGRELMLCSPTTKGTKSLNVCIRTQRGRQKSFKRSRWFRELLEFYVVAPIATILCLRLWKSVDLRVRGPASQHTGPAGWSSWLLMSSLCLTDLLLSVSLRYQPSTPVPALYPVE